MSVEEARDILKDDNLSDEFISDLINHTKNIVGLSIRNIAVLKKAR